MFQKFLQSTMQFFTCFSRNSAALFGAIYWLFNLCLFETNKNSNHFFKVFFGIGCFHLFVNECLLYFSLRSLFKIPSCPPFKHYAPFSLKVNQSHDLISVSVTLLQDTCILVHLHTNKCLIRRQKTFLPNLRGFFY